MPRPLLLALVLVASMVACQEPAPQNGIADTGITLARSSDAKDSLIRVKDSLLAERSRQLSEQGQLLGDAATSARLASQIERALAEVRSLRVREDSTTPETPVPSTAAQLTTVDKKVKLLIARLNASESRVRRMRRDSTTHASFDSTQLARLAEYERSIGELRATVERQQQEIAQLSQRVDSMRQENRVLVAKNDTMTARNLAMAAREDSVFVVVGTAKELIAGGVVRREGGSRLLFRAGRTLVPARSLDPTRFRVISKSRDQAIPLPNAAKKYRVVSRHSLQYTDAAAAKDASVRGALRITNPDAFWAPSKFLILVER